MSATSAILAFAAAPHALPPQVRADALRLLADTLAVMAAGAASREAAQVRAALSPTPALSSRPVLAPHPVRPELVEGPSFSSARVKRKNGPSTSSGQTGFDHRTGTGDTAFHNGFAIHCLEWDAVHEGAVVHAMSVVTAALLASSDRAGGSDPEEFLTALAVGVDIASGLGIAATGPMRFFRPATAGVIGAALAVARLEALAPPPALRFADVLGFAYSFAGGTMQAHVEGSIALPMQIGRAAQAAIQAVDLARAGLTAPHDVLEGPFGYSALIEPLDLARYIVSLGQTWHISDISIKPFPSGRASHGALGALQQLRDHDLNGVALHDIAAIILHAPPLIQRLVGRRYRPGADPSINRLCLGFLAPLMLRDGYIDPRLSATDALLAGRTDVVVDTNGDGNAMNPQRLVVKLADGRMIERHIPATLGSPAAPMTGEQQASKYALCRDLAGDCDPRIFDDPLGYATSPFSPC